MVVYINFEVLVLYNLDSGFEIWYWSVRNQITICKINIIIYSQEVYHINVHNLTLYQKTINVQHCYMDPWNSIKQLNGNENI